MNSICSVISNAHLYLNSQALYWAFCKDHGAQCYARESNPPQDGLCELIALPVARTLLHKSVKRL